MPVADSGQCLNRFLISGLLLKERLKVGLGIIQLPPPRLKTRKAHSTEITELETHQRDASAANRALELLGREVNLFIEKKEGRQARRL